MTQPLISRLVKLYFPNSRVLREQRAHQVPGKASNDSVMLKSSLHQLNKKILSSPSSKINSVLWNLATLKSIMKNIPFIFFYPSEFSLSLIPVLGMTIPLSLHNPTAAFKYFILSRRRTDLSFQARLIHSFNTCELRSSVTGDTNAVWGLDPVPVLVKFPPQ